MRSFPFYLLPKLTTLGSVSSWPSFAAIELGNGKQIENLV